MQGPDTTARRQSRGWRNGDQSHAALAPEGIGRGGAGKDETSPWRNQWACVSMMAGHAEEGWRERDPPMIDAPPCHHLFLISLCSVSSSFSSFPPFFSYLGMAKPPKRDGVASRTSGWDGKGERRRQKDTAQDKGAATLEGLEHIDSPLIGTQSVKILGEDPCFARHASAPYLALGGGGLASPSQDILQLCKMKVSQLAFGFLSAGTLGPAKAADHSQIRKWMLQVSYYCLL